LKSSSVTHFHKSGVPISSILCLDDNNGDVFVTTDLGGEMNIYDSRQKIQIMKHKCGAAPALLSLAKTNYAFNAQPTLACGAENGLTYLYDLKAQKMCPSSVFDSKMPFPVYDMCFNQNNPEKLYTAGLFNLTETVSNKQDEAGKKVWFLPQEIEASFNSTSSTHHDLTSTTRSVLYGSEQCNFVSLDCDNRGNMVAVSDNGLIVSL